MVKRAILALGVALLVVGLALPAGAATKDRALVHDFATGEPVPGGRAVLHRTDDSIASKVRTYDVEGHVYTLWYVIFNAPQNCSGEACGEDDIFNADGTFNAAQIEAARVSVVSGQAGTVAKRHGYIQLHGGIAEGEIPEGANRLVIGLEEDGALVPLGVVSGLEDAMAAEVHIVIQSHGMAHEDPELLEQQLTMFMGACNPECADVQFAVHLP